MDFLKKPKNTSQAFPTSICHVSVLLCDFWIFKLLKHRYLVLFGISTVGIIGRTRLRTIYFFHETIVNDFRQIKEKINYTQKSNNPERFDVRCCQFMWQLKYYKYFKISNIISFIVYQVRILVQLYSGVQNSFSVWGNIT